MKRASQPSKKQGKPSFDTVDPRIKILFFSLFFPYLFLLPNPLSLKHLIAFLLMVSTMVFLRISIRSLIKRIWLIVPLLIFLTILVLLFSPAPGQDKMAIVCNLYAKSMLVLLAVILFTAALNFNQIIKGLKSLHLPDSLLTMLFFSHHYVFLFRQELERFRRSVRSRTGDRNNIYTRVKIIIHIIPVLFRRTLDRGEKIYITMVSRGFKNKIPCIHQLKLQKGDAIFLVYSCFLILIAIMLP